MLRTEQALDNFGEWLYENCQSMLVLHDLPFDNEQNHKITKWLENNTNDKYLFWKDFIFHRTDNIIIVHNCWYLLKCYLDSNCKNVHTFTSKRFSGSIPFKRMFGRWLSSKIRKHHRIVLDCYEISIHKRKYGKVKFYAENIC